MSPISFISSLLRPFCQNFLANLYDAVCDSSFTDSNFPYRCYHVITVIVSLSLVEYIADHTIMHYIHLNSYKYILHMSGVN